MSEIEGRMPASVPRFYEVLRVFIACPGDLSAERSRFPRVLDTVNTLRAHTMGFHLEPVGWERVVPSFGRPQDLINQELQTADLILVLFWNHIGSPSALESEVTGTVEEFELAKKLCGYDQKSNPLYETQRPWLYLYFRAQTEPDSDSARKVLDLRKAEENSKRLLYRYYTDENEWEALLREHLVAFLNGRKRKDIEKAVQSLPPANAVLKGKFIWQDIYTTGTVLRVSEDFDGDDIDENVTFRFQQTQHWITYAKGIEKGYETGCSTEFREFLAGAQTIHLAIKDVNNDGIPELLIAADSGVALAKLGIWGVREGRFAELCVLDGQRYMYIYENGHIVMPYGSVGLYCDYRWNPESRQFDRKDLFDPLRSRSAF